MAIATMKLQDIKFKETCHFAIENFYQTSYKSVNCEPVVMMDVVTPRDSNGFACSHASKKFRIVGKLVTRTKLKQMCEAGDIKLKDEEL